MQLVLGENLASSEARHLAFHDHNRRGRRVYNRSRGEPLRQRDRASRAKSDDYHIDWFSWRAVYEYAGDVDPAIDCS